MKTLQSKLKQFLNLCFHAPLSFKVHTLILLFCYVLPEFNLFISITPTARIFSLVFGFLCALVLSGICLSFPRIIGKIFFAVSNLAITVWAMAQIIYYGLFHRLMWIKDIAFASDGVIFMDDVLNFYAPPLWWILVAVSALTYYCVGRMIRYPLAPKGIDVFVCALHF